jgi:hypothetical protein
VSAGGLSKTQRDLAWLDRHDDRLWRLGYDAADVTPAGPVYGGVFGGCGCWGWWYVWSGICLGRTGIGSPPALS